MTEKNNLLIFSIDDIQCALPLENVIKVESVVETIPIPGAPPIVSGVVNVHGTLLPVMDVRQRLQQPTKEIALDDHLILATTQKRTLALWVGAVLGVEEHHDAEHDHLHDILKTLPHLSGVTSLDDDLILIHDLEQFLSEDEDEALTLAMGALTI